MKIICNQCGAKYQIKADKVKNKPFKIRCKRCENAIVVRPEEVIEQTAQVHPAQIQAAQAQAQAAQAQAAQAQAAQAQNEQVNVAAQGHHIVQDIWYAFIYEQQAGPFNEEQLIHYWQEGGLTKDSYVWCEGMAGWEMITQVPQLRHIWEPMVASASIPVDRNVQQQQQPIHYEADAHTPQVNQSEVSLHDPASVAHSYEAVLPHSSHSISETADGDLMSSSAPVLKSSEKKSESLESQALRNQRNENSVLFSLESLGAGQEEIKIHNHSHNSEASGLIDLKSLSADSTGNQAPINLTIGLPRQQTMVSHNKNNLKIIILSVITATLLAIFAVFYFFNLSFNIETQAITQPKRLILGDQAKVNLNPMALNKKPIPANVDTLNPKKNQQTAPSTLKEQSQSEAVQAGVSAQSNEQAEDAPKVKDQSTPKATVKKQKRNKRKPKTKTRKKTRSPRSTKNTRRRSAPPTSSSSSEANDILKSIREGKSKGSSSRSSGLPTSKPRSGPKKPSKSNIKSTLRRVNLKGCSSRDPSLRGTVKVKIKAVSSGAITNAKVTNDPFRGTAVATCIEREVRRQRFESFTDQSIQFTFPWRL